MNDSPKADQEQIDRSKAAIRDLWKCEPEKEPITKVYCDLSPVQRCGYVYVFKLLSVPDEFQPAKLCFAWYGRVFYDRKGGALKDFEKCQVAVLDTEVPFAVDLSNLNNAAYIAVWLWLLRKLKKETKANYFESKKWTKETLDDKDVEFVLNNEIKTGRFFVLKRPDGKISVRIIHNVLFEFEGLKIKEPMIESIILKQNEIEDIESPKAGSDPYSFKESRFSLSPDTGGW